VHRFTSAAHLASWAGLTPRHRESDTVVRRGPITKQGSTLVRWAAVEASMDDRVRAARRKPSKRQPKRVAEGGQAAEAN
jgi:transposase